MAKNRAAWTVMVYLAGDNNLTTECLFALTEMKKAAPGRKINVIAQFDPRDNYLPTHRYEINRTGAESNLVDDIIDEARYNPRTGEVHFRKESRNANAMARVRLATRSARPAVPDDSSLHGSPDEDEVVTDDTDTGSPITLYNFISFCLEEYPADHYIVVLSGHSGGTERDYLLKDESSTGSLTFNELKHVFERVKQDREGKAIDILGMDNCLMSMAEICYELRGLVEIVVGCESYSPASGWPYRQILERLKRDFIRPKLSKRQSIQAETAKAIVEEYVDYYSSYWISGLSISQSALDISKVEQLKDIVDKLATELERELLGEYERDRKSRSSRKTVIKDAVVLAHWEAQSYNGELFVDLFDFCDRLENRLEPCAIAKRCREVNRFIANEFVLKSCYSGAVYQYSYGVSMYFPWSDVVSTYRNLDFVRDGTGAGWGNFLRTYVLVTRREPRGMDRRSRLGELGSGITMNNGMSSDRMSSDRMSSDRISSDRMSSDRMSSDRMSSDRMSSDRVFGNPIHSMRNPPVVFFPGECIKERRHVIVGQERFLAEE